MKYNIFIITIFLTICISSLAQRATISGKVMDKEKQEPLMFANCILRYKSDTTGIFKGAASDTAGNFEFKNIKKRDLILEVQYIGFKNYKKEIPASMFDNGKKIELGNIFLEIDGELETVTVTAQRKRIKIDDDKMTVNIDEGMANMVNNAFDLLRLVPGVMIDNDENIKLNGKSGVAFQYDGRELKLDLEAIKDMLKSMSPEMVDGYEILKNPGVKYDADGTAGIINIKLKKNQNYGINGSIGISGSRQDVDNYGFYPSARLNYVDDKWIISGGYSFSERGYGNPSKADSSLRYLWAYGDTTLFRSISEKYHSKNRGNNFNFSASYSLDTTSTIAFYSNYSQRKSPMSTRNSPMLMSHSPNYYMIDSSYNSGNKSEYNSDRLSMGISYVKKLDSLDSKISSDLDFSINSSNNDNLNQVDYYMYRFDSIYRSQGYKRKTDNSSKYLSLRMDYFKPINKQMRFEAGVKAKVSFINRDYNSKFLSDGIYVNNEMESNNFKYFENINSLYASFTNKFFDNKLSLRMGLRLEQTNTTGKQQALETTIKQNYFNVFPNIRLSYKFKEDNEISLDYSYRIWRPWSESLNPFISRSSDYAFSTGNPNLKPEGSHYFSLSHSFKYMLFTSISYYYSKDEINYITTPIDDSYNFEHNDLAVINYPINTGHSNNVSFNLNFNKDIVQNCYFSVNYGVSYSHVEASLPIEEVDRENWSHNLSANIFYTFLKKWRISAYWFYVSSSLNAISKSNGFQWLGANMGRSFLNDKLNFNLGCNWSLFHKSYNETKYANMLSKSWSRATPPNFNVSVTWKFGKFYQNKQIKKQQLDNFDDRKGSQ